MTARPRPLVAACAVVFMTLAGTFARAQQSTVAPLTHLQFDIIGVRLVVDPPALTVPKNIATQINTSLVTPPGLGDEVRQAIATLTDGAQVEAVLRGPSLQPTRIAVVPGQPIPIPPLATPGDYFLDGIRLAKNGQTILDATTAAGLATTTIPIHVINEVLVASVTSSPLSLDDIRSKGIVIDSKNFSAVNFQVAFNIDGASFTISAPAVLPTPELLATGPDRTVLVQQISALNRQLAATLTTLPPQFDRPGLNFSIAALPFFPVDNADNGDPGFATPPITGLIVIPGNVAFLNQFFSALLLVADVAPDGTPLVLQDVTGTITLPTGLDRVAGTYDAPGDDPLRLARVDGVGTQPTIRIAQRGPDGELGTADDIFIIPPQKQGEGEFLIEGLKEGSQTFDIAIKATLLGLPSGPVNLQGQAAGAVFVRNPTFAVTLGQPKTVRSGEPYTIYATVTNTSSTAANLVSVNLDPRSITGAQLLSDATVTFDHIAPGQSAVATYSMVAQLTGDVTFSSFTGDAALGGGIRLETGVDERGVALSANSIVLPQSTDFLPASLVAAAQRVLGQAFSVATAPAEALPSGVLFVKRQTVIDRGTELAEAGERVKFGEPLARVVEDLLLDWLGNTTFDAGFDQSLRTTDAGSALMNELAAIVGPAAVQAGALDYQRQFAGATVTRAGHLSAIASGPDGAPVPALTITQEAGGAIGLDSEGGAASSLPSGVLLSGGTGGDGVRLAVVAQPSPDQYTVELVAPVAGLFDLGVVIPTGAPAQLQQMRFSHISLDAGGIARVTVDLASASTAALSIDRNGDGVIDASASPDTAAIAAGAPQLLAVRQLESSSRDLAADLSDPAAYGLLIAALFDRPVTESSSELKANYTIASNQVIGAALQHGGRLVYLYLQKPVGGLTPRSLVISNIEDERGNVLPSSTLPITMILTDGAHVFGQVRDAGGAGVGGGVLTLTVTSANGPTSFQVSALQTDSNGGFDFDFIPRIGDQFTLTAQHPVTRDLATITARIRGAGEQMLLNPTFLGRGKVTGRVIGPDGTTSVPNVPIALIPGSVLGSLGFQGQTNALGEFTFTDVPVGVFTLSASDGRGAFGQATGVIGHGGDTVTQNLPLVTQPQDGGQLIGRVFLSDGTTPAAAFTVYVGSYSREHASIAAVDSTVTDASGTFTFSRTLPAGDYDVVAVDPGSQQLGTRHTSVIARTTSSVSIVLEAVGAVEGVVFNGRGERVAGALVAGGTALVSTDANGFFRIEGVPAGTRTIEAGDPASRRRGSATVSVLSGLTASAAITLESRATITGRVLDANGNPVPGASVRIPAIDGYTFVIANNQGVFTLPDLTPGDYLIQAPGPSKESLIDFLSTNGVDPRTAFTSGDAPDDAGNLSPPAAGDTNAVLAAYQKAVQTFFSVDDTSLTGLPMASLGGFGWNKVSLFQDATTVVADVKFLSQGTVSGQTVDGAGRPTGAAVRLSTLTVTTTGFPGFGELSRLNSDPADGLFSFGGIARFDLGTFQAAGVRAGDFTLEAANPFSPVHPQFRGQLSTATPNMSGVVLAFPAAVDTNGTISGRVFQPDGVTPAPAGTQVGISFGNLAVTTGADGVFHSLLPIPAGSYTVTAQMPNGLRGQTIAIVPPGGNVDVQLRVLGLGALTVVVTRPGGVPVANAQVNLQRASFPGDRADGTTDGSGAVHFVNITEGAFSVMAVETTTGLAGRASAAIVRDGDLTLPVVITGSGVVTGTFLGAGGGSPIPFAQIVLASNGVQAYASTDVNGRFALAAIPVGAFTAEGFDPLTNRRGRVSGSLQFEGQSVDIAILEAPRGTVTGFVVNADGVSTVAAARVSLTGASFIQTRLQATALGDGSFRFDGVPAGDFTLDATDPVSGFSGTAHGTVTFEGQTVDSNVALAPFGAVHVTVFDVNGQPASNASVTIAGRVAAVDAQGEFTFENLALDTYHVVARSLADANNGGDVTVTLQTANQVADTTIRLRGVGSLTVTVVPASGTGVVGSAEVTVNAQGASGAPGPLATTLTGFTDSTGAVTFASVPIGDFSVRAESAALAGVTTGAIPGANTNVAAQVQLGASGSVTGRVLLPDGVTAATSAFVTLRFMSQTSLQSGVLQITTDLTGSFEFRGIPLGTFSLSAIEVASNGVRSASGSIAADGQRVDLGSLTLDNTAPRILQVSPADRSGNVPGATAIVITFSEPVAPGSITAGSISDAITLFEGSALVPLAAPQFSSDGMSVTLHPTRALTSGVLESLAVKGAPDGPKDQSGLAMIDPFVSTFTVRDSIPPMVVSSSPASGAVQVSPDSVVRVAFSEPVAGVTMSVRTGANVPVAGTTTLAAGGTAAIFTPADFLPANTTFTVSVQNVADLAGNPLAGGSFAAGFATIDTIAPAVTALQLVGTPRVGASVVIHPTVSGADVQRIEYSLGTVFVGAATQAPFDGTIVLPDAPSTTVSAVAFDQVGNRSSPFTLAVVIQPNAPPTVALTNVSGVTAVGQGQSVNFSVHATDDVQLGQVFFTAVGAASMSVVQPVAAGQTDFTQTFTLTVPATAPSNSTITVQAGATDAAGAQSVPASSIILTVRDAARPTVTVLSPVNNAVVAAGQTVDVVADAADDVALASVQLACNPALVGCEARPVVPQAASSRQTFTVTVPPTAQAPQTLALTIVATDTSGNTFAAGRVLQIADTVKPTVTAVESTSGSTHVAAGTAVLLRATVVDNVGVTSLLYTTDGAVTTSGTSPVSPALVSGTATFSIVVPAGAPNGPATVHVRARDAAGNLSDEAALVLSVGDSAPPVLTLLEPVDGGAVAPGGTLIVHASATDDVGVARFTIAASGSVSTADARDIVPAATPADATFTIPVPASTAAGPITLRVEAFDATGNSSKPIIRTVNVTDVVAPAVQIVSPVQNDAFDPRTPIAVTVQATDAVGVASIALAASGSVSAAETHPVAPAATTRIEPFVVTVTPLPIAGGTVTFNATARDAAGNAGASLPITVRILDVVAPDVQSVQPAAGATGVDRNASIVVRFTEPMDRATLSAASMQLLRAGTAVPSALAIAAGDDVATLTPTVQPLAPSTVYTVVVSASAADKAGNTLPAPRTISFTTASPDTTAPKVASVSPPNNAVDVSLGAPIDVTFTDAVDPATINAQSFRVHVGSNPVAGALSFLSANTVVRFTPADPLPTDAVVVTDLSGDITDAFGNRLVAADGSPITTPLTFAFVTGTFSLTSPVGTEVVENSAVLLEARAGGALGVATVVFTVNGSAQPAASGPPFTRSFNVGSASVTPTLTIVASARDAGGTEVARDERTYDVVVGLKVTPTLSGVAVGARGTLAFSVSSALDTDLPIVLSAGDPTLVSFPVNPVVLTAGQTRVAAAFAGVSTGATAIVGSSSHGTAAAIVAVSPLQSGQVETPTSSTVGLAISNPPAAGTVILQPGTLRTVHVVLLAAPAAADTVVSVFSTNSAAATATEVTIPAGQQAADVPITTLADGVASLIFHAGGEVRSLTVFVGTPPAGSTPIVSASPVGLALSGAPNAGQVIAAAGKQFTVTVQLLSTPAGADTPVSVTVDNPAVATAVAAVIPAGQTSTAVTITTTADGTTSLLLRAGGEVRAVTIFVGAPAGNLAPVLFASPVGASVAALPTLGRTYAPLGAVRTIGVRVFGAPAAADTIVTITTSDASVASASPAIVHAGEQVAALELTTGAAGTATLTLEAGGVRRELTIVVGSDPTPGTTPPIVAAPVGVTVVPNPSIGRLFGQVGSASAPTLGIPLLDAPAGAAIAVSISSNNPDVVSLGGSATATSVINAGEQVLHLSVTISGAQGAALLTFEFSGERRELLVVVGTPPASEIPAVTAPLVGVRVGP